MSNIIKWNVIVLWKKSHSTKKKQNTPQFHSFRCGVGFLQPPPALLQQRCFRSKLFHWEPRGSPCSTPWCKHHARWTSTRWTSSGSVLSVFVSTERQFFPPGFKRRNRLLVCRLRGFLMEPFKKELCKHKKSLPGTPSVLFFLATLPLKPATISLKIGHLAFQVELFSMANEFNVWTTRMEIIIDVTPMCIEISYSCVFTIWSSVGEQQPPMMQIPSWPIESMYGIFTGMSCWYLVTGWFHPYISRL